MHGDHDGCDRCAVSRSFVAVPDGIAGRSALDDASGQPHPALGQQRPQDTGAVRSDQVEASARTCGCGRPVGAATRTRASGTDGYRTRPTWPWAQDTHSYYLSGKDSAAHWTNDFRSAKANVQFAKATAGTSGPGVQVESDGRDSVRLVPTQALLVDDASPGIVYTGAWTHADISAGYTVGDLFGTESFTDAAGATAELMFTGTGVGFYSALAENLGIMKVYVDGTLAGSVDLYGPGKSPGQLVFRSAPLPYGVHTIKIECTGEKNNWAKAAYVLVDAFRVVDPIIDDTSPRISYSGTWTHADESDAWTSGDLNHTESFSKTVGATASATFQGTGIRVIRPKGPRQGIAEISVDGEPAVRVELHADNKQYQQKAFVRTGLTDGEETITVKVTGDKNVNYPDLAWGYYTDPSITLEAGQPRPAYACWPDVQHTDSIKHRPGPGGLGGSPQTRAPRASCAGPASRKGAARRPAGGFS
ncbi:hypothetical protein [Streptomyces sp. NBC_01506]|uniref:hypothetical protein n=1 Tax=Streptomyces sp. NBC_01506 TaxID=2903887 RepID=UPI003870D7BD